MNARVEGTNAGPSRVDRQISLLGLRDVGRRGERLLVGVVSRKGAETQRKEEEREKKNGLANCFVCSLLLLAVDCAYSLRLRAFA
jgi:hypothetical protein